MSDENAELPASRKPRPSAELPPSVLQILSDRTGEAPRVTLRDEDSAAAGAPVIDPASDERKALPQGRSSYQVLGEIARGGMGVILKGHDTDLGRDVAMKVLARELAQRPEVVQRFVEEAQIGGQLQHPGIVPVYELGLMADERPYFTMKLVKGRTLATLLAERESVGAERRRLIDIFESVCQTMAYAHSRGVIHRDLKPANIMVGAFGEVQVVDWGLAKVMARGGTADEKRAKQVHTQLTVLETVRSEGSGSGSESMVGSVMGTPAYMPPEQASGRVDRLDERSDVFALGAILCEILTGLPPYAGERDQIILQASQADTDDAATRLDGSGADPELVKLCKQCLMAAPAARPRNAGVVAESVHRHLETVEERARGAQIEAAEARVRATQERKARKLTLALAAAVVAALALGGGGWAWAQNERATRERELVQRQHQLEGEVNEALNEASLLAGQERWDEAVGAAERAQAVAATGEVRIEVTARVASVLEEVRAAADGARQRAESARDTERLLSKLQDARDPGWSRIDPGSSELDVDAERAQAFAEAFRAHGLDVQGSSPDEIAAALSERGLGADVALFLDAWSDALRADREERGALHLLEVAHRVDPDPVRADLREAVANRDAEMLRSLAEGDLAAQPPATLELLAAALVRLEDEGSAARVLREAVGIHPEDVSLHVALARLLTPGQDPPGDAVQRAAYLEGLSHDWAALALRPDSVAVRYHLGRLYQRLGELDRALELFEQATRAEPDNATVRLSLGITLSQQGADPVRAIAELRRARELSEVWWIRFWGHFFEAQALQQQGALDEALEHCRIALDIQPGHTRPGSFALQLEVERGDLDGALLQLEETLPFSRNPGGLYNDLAWFLVSMPAEAYPDPDLAARAIDEAVRLAEHSVETLQEANSYNTLSIARVRAGDGEGALQAAQQALLLGKGGLPQDWLALSLAYASLGDMDQARLWYLMADSNFALHGFGGDDLRYLHGEAARALGLPAPQHR